MLTDFTVRLAAEGYLDEAWSIAQAIDHAFWRVEALLRLMTYLPQAEQPVIVAEALLAARSIRRLIPEGGYGRRAGHWAETPTLEPAARAKALARIARHLRRDERLAVLHEAIIAAQQADYPGDFAIAGLAPYIASLGFPEQAYPLAQRVAKPFWRVQALAALAPHLPDEERAAVFVEALAIVRTLEKTSSCTPALDEVIPYLEHVPPMERYPLWCEMIHLMAREDRDAVLRQIQILMPIITSLGEQEAVALARQAIVEVGQWFP